MKSPLILCLQLGIILLSSLKIHSMEQYFLETLLHSRLNELWAKMYAFENENLSARIIGGQVARNGEFPYMVALKSRSGKLLCGGSLINDQHVLTAAHCVQGVDPSLIRAVMGTRLLSDAGTVRGVSNIWTNAGFNFNSFDYDVAVLKLASPVPLSARIQPICLTTSSTTNRYNGRRVTVIGWGRRREVDRRTSDNLRKVAVPIINTRICQRSYRHFRSITDRMLCAGFRRGGKDSCQGDSGGPMILKIGARISQLGIVSWGNGCARPGYYGVYTRIPQVLPWIKRHTTVQECS